jgi:hypothetical protein
VLCDEASSTGLAGCVVGTLRVVAEEGVVGVVEDFGGRLVVVGVVELAGKGVVAGNDPGW